MEINLADMQFLDDLLEGSEGAIKDGERDEDVPGPDEVFAMFGEIPDFEEKRGAGLSAEYQKLLNGEFQEM